MTIDLQFAIALGLIWTMAVCAIAYLVGLSHGREEGYLRGSAEEARKASAKIIRAKYDGNHVGWLCALKWMIHGEETTLSPRPSARPGSRERSF